MIKFRLYLDKDTETAWLNKMAAEGWALTKFFAGFYSFEQTEKGKYIYQIDFGDRMFAVSDAYKEFMEDTGVEIVQTWGYWIFLRRLTAEGAFELYTDVDSSIEHYTKIRKMFKVVTIIELLCLFMEVFAGIAGNSWGYAFAFLLGAFVLALINSVYKLNGFIAELNERKTGIASEITKQNISPFIAVGLLLNSCALMMGESVSGAPKLGVHLLAIVFMLVGAYQTVQKKHRGI